MGSQRVGNDSATEQQQKIKKGTTIWPKPHFKYILQRNENMILKKYMYSHFYYSIILNNQDMETIQMSISGWMCKKNRLYMYIWMLLSHEKGEPVKKVDVYRYIRILLSHEKKRNTTI